MQVKVSKVMVKFLNDNLLKSKGYKAVFQEFTPDQYSLYVSYNIMDNENDYNYNSGKMKSIKIVYPDNYYANSRYLTTNDLVKIFNNSDKTVSGFLNQLWNEIEI